MTWLIILIALLVPSLANADCTKAATTYTCTGDLATLKDLFRNGHITAGSSPIQEGDTVHVTAGTWVWTGPLVAGWSTVRTLPGFTFEGASESTTTFQIDPTYSQAGTEFGGFMVFVQQASSGLTTFQNFTIDANGRGPLDVAPAAGYLLMVTHGLDKYRVTHVTLNNLASARGFAHMGPQTATGFVEASGLWDHVTCNTKQKTTVQNNNVSAQCFVVRGDWHTTTAYPYLYPKTLGDNHAVYIEDSTCNYLSTADDCIDTSLGSNLVFRYNTSNFSIGIHGADSSFRGARIMEAYRNKFLATTTAHYAANWRTGPDIFFDNVYASGTPAYSANSIDATLYRTNGTTSYLAGLCTGVNAIDGNLGSGAIPTGNIGWPCVDQTGWYFPAAAPTTWTNGTHAQYWPAYIWENSIAGVNAGITLNDSAVPCTGTCTFTSTYVVSDRDYYAGGIVAQTSSSSPFDGTTGVGFGTLARRPATCTTNTATNALAATLGGGTGGVAYWAIDQGSWNGSVTDGAFNPRGVNGESGILYKCTATNTWTAYYTPYTYPHPLQGSAPAIPSAPTGLRTLGTSTGTSCTVTWNESGLANLVGYHLSYGTSTGAYTTTVTKTLALSTAAHQPPRQHTFRFPVAGTYYITVTGFSASVSDTAAATEVTCVSTGLSRSATTSRGAHQ